MYELQERRRAAKADGTATPPTPTSFDALVDDEGKLKAPALEKELPTPPSTEPVPDYIQAEMREVERNLGQPVVTAESSASSSGWQLGSQLANPFGDEYELDRSETPKPPVPPKIQLEQNDGPQTPRLPGSWTPSPAQPLLAQSDETQEELSYEEQLAIALSLSEAESQSSANAGRAERSGSDEDDADLRAAIEASLKEMDNGKSAPAMGQPAPHLETLQPLVDLTPPSPTIQHQQPTPRGHWETVFDQEYSPNQEPLSLASPSVNSEEEDELYRITPQLTHARLASLDALQNSSPAAPTVPSAPYDPVREAAGQLREPQQAMQEASFYSAASSAPSPASTHTLDHEATPQLIDITEDLPAAGLRTPTNQSSFGFQTDTESDSDTFASLSDPASRAQSRPRSEMSHIEVVDVLDDSDVDMLSEEGDGVVTPDSWTEVGSRDGESEMEDEQPRARGST